MNVFVLLESGLLKKSSLQDNEFFFGIFNSLCKNLLQVLSEDLLIFVFDWRDLASELNYENVEAIFLTLLKSMFGIFYDYSYDFTICHNIFY